MCAILADDSFPAGGVWVLAVVYLGVKVDRFEDGSVVDEFLGAHTGPSKHCQSSVLEFSVLHVSESGGVGGLEAERIESDVTGVIVVSELPQGSGPRTKVGLDPSDLCSSEFGGSNGRGEQGKGRKRNLLQLVVGRSGQTEGSSEGFTDEVSDGSHHGNTAVHDFGLAVALDFVQSDSIARESNGVKVSGGRKSSGESKARKAFVGNPSVDRSRCDDFGGGFLSDGRKWLGKVFGGGSKSSGGNIGRQGSKSTCGGNSARKKSEFHHDGNFGFVNFRNAFFVNRDSDFMTL